jgi:MOSC domain-containing protein YiiM
VSERAGSPWNLPARNLVKVNSMGQSGRPPYPHVHQINVSNGGVPKHPVFEAKISKEGLEGDRQRNLKVHGGPNRAVCLFSVELIERMQDEGHSIDGGSSGENLTLAGLAWDTLDPGTRLKIGPDVLLEVTSYCAPCEWNARWFRDGDITRISQKVNPGWSRLYARVLQGGVVRPGDVVVIEQARGGGRGAEIRS